jgi:6-phosphogluconate dehydrogenase (decarboxylating)
MSRITFLRGFLVLIVGVLLSPVGSHALAADAPKGKLVVTKAVYGDLPDGAKTDVTAKVSGMVKDNELTVDATNENFEDPAEGIVKKLKVEYTVDGVAHSKTVNELETLAISGKPSRLVIRKALYGDLPDGAKTDVTEKVSDKIKDDALTVEATNENFGDPADGITKKLKVDYTFEGKEKSKTVSENETLTISSKGD